MGRDNFCKGRQTIQETGAKNSLAGGMVLNTGAHGTLGSGEKEAAAFKFAFMAAGIFPR